jgi:hypothetical protein
MSRDTVVSNHRKHTWESVAIPQDLRTMQGPQAAVWENGYDAAFALARGTEDSSPCAVGLRTEYTWI